MTTPTGRTEASEMSGGAATQEPRAGDNVLELDITDPKFAEAADWEDGQEYVIHELRATQVSPGKFTPTSMEGGELASDEEQPEPAGEDQGAGEEKPEYPNPAISKMKMGKGMSKGMMED